MPNPPVKPLPLKPAPPAVDIDAPLDDDFDAILQAEAEAARQKPLADFAPKGEAQEPEVDVTRATPKDAIDAQREAAKAAAATTTPEEKPGTTQSAASEPAARDAAATPQATAQPATEQPAAQPAQAAVAPAPFDANESFSLTADYKLTRAQMIQALNERHGAINEAATFRKIFRMGAEEAQNSWGPLVDKMVAKPELAQYLQDCIDHFEAHSSGTQTQNAPENQPYGDPAARARITQLEQQIKAQEQRHQTEQIERAKAAIESERQALMVEYPALQDPQIMQMVAARALDGVQRDPSYTLTRAAKDLSVYLGRLAPAQTAAPAQAPAVPALNGSGGASPVGSRKPASKPKIYESPDDAAEAWIREDAAAAGFGS